MSFQINHMLRGRLSAAVLLALGAGNVAATAADMTARQVAVAVFKAPPGAKIDLTGKNLSELDLAGIDFRSAMLARTDLYGSDLSGANLEGTDLSGSKLDRAIMTKTNFKGANLEGVTILKPSIFSTPDFNVAETPVFAGAHLKRARIAARMDSVNFRGADLSEASIGPFDMSVEGGLAPSSLMKGADFTDANLQGVDIRNVDFTFGRFTGANLKGARLTSLNLTNADFSGADLTDAVFSGCNFEGVKLTGAKGLNSVKGLETATNVDQSAVKR
ncbi:MAG: pentapeptide repeat-containing protein [Hyphomicrobiaceae bacterium]